MKKQIFLFLILIGFSSTAFSKQWIVFCSQKNDEHAYLVFIKESPSTGELIEKKIGFGPVVISPFVLIGTAGTISDNSEKTARYFFIIDVDEKEYDLCWQTRLNWDKSIYHFPLNDCLSFMKAIAEHLKGKIKIPKDVDVLRSFLPSWYVSKLLVDNIDTHNSSMKNYLEIKRNYILLSAYTKKTLYKAWEPRVIKVLPAFWGQQSSNCLLISDVGNTMLSSGRTYEYNEFGVLIKETELGLRKGFINKTTTYTYGYDKNNKPVKMIALVDDVLLSTKYTQITECIYNDDGNVIEWKQTSDEKSFPYISTERYTYDSYGQLLTAKRVESNQIIQENKYNQVGKLIEVRYMHDDPKRNVVEIEYDELSREKLIKSKGRIIGYRKYDNDGRIIDEKGINNSLEYQNQYTYSGSKLTSVLSYSTGLTEFNYNEKGDLVSAIKFSTKIVSTRLVKNQIEEKSEFDEYGNINSFTQVMGGGSKNVYTYICK